jgi:hypothetical protein
MMSSIGVPRPAQVDSRQVVGGDSPRHRNLSEPGFDPGNSAPGHARGPRSDEFSALSVDRVASQQGQPPLHAAASC